MAKPSPAVGQESDPEVKNVQIFSNGDRFAPGRHVVLNTRQIRNFETFLDELTRILNPLHGAIRRLYTPVNGTPVEDTKDLREGAGYVAAGKEKFKKLSYYEIQPLSPRRGKGPKFPYFDIKPVTHSQFRVSGKVKKINIQNKKIVVFPNGQFFLPPSIIVLNQNDQASMETVMHSVGIKVDLPQGGFPERLYTLEGSRVDSTEKVTNGTMYVAASHREKFKPGPYGPYMRMGQVKFPSRLTPLNKKKYGQKGSDSEHSQENSTASDYSSSKRSRKSRATTRDAENGVFHVRPVKHKRSPEKTAGRQADYDKDEGGIYKSKLRNPNAEDATEVSETDQTRVDMPVDNMEAKQVDDKSDGHTGPIKESHPEEDKSSKDYVKNTPDEIAPISLPEHVPDVPVEGTDVDEEPNITPIKDADELAGSSQVTRKEGPTSSQPEKDEIQVPPPEQTVVAASPSEETESLGTENTEDALKEEMSQPPHEMNEMK